jgi:hypothetical protein
MFVLRWSSKFDFGMESTSTPIWVNLLGLRVHLQNPTILKAIKGMSGKYLRTNQIEKEFTHPGVSSICVEMDLSKELKRESNLCSRILL